MNNNIKTAFLREKLLKSIKLADEFSEIENTVDEYVDSIIENMESDISDLRAESERLNALLIGGANESGRLRTENAELRAENAELRAALKDCVE